MRYIITAVILCIICLSAKSQSINKRDSLILLETVTYRRIIVTDSIEKEHKHPKNKGPWKYDRINRTWVDSTKRKV